MKEKKDIEKAVSSYFKVDVDSIYKAYKSKYPVNGAKLVLMYLLYKNGHKIYDIAKWFGFTTTVAYRHCGEVQVALKSDTKIKEDIKRIEKQLKAK